MLVHRNNQSVSLIINLVHKKFLDLTRNVKNFLGVVQILVCSLKTRFEQSLAIWGQVWLQPLVLMLFTQVKSMIGKTELLESIAGKNRGLLATETERQSILAAIAQLEDRNPTPRAVEALDLLEGDWRLLYTSSRGILGINQVPLLQLGQVYQCIRVAQAKVYNIAELVGLPFAESIVSVAATFKPVSERRVDVKFNRSIVGLQRLMDYQSPSQYIEQIESGKKFTAIDFNLSGSFGVARSANRDQQGWLDITYLDADLRIGRGNEGSVFVLTKS